MSQEMINQINYTVVCVNEFAQKNNLSIKEAFLYLYNHKGIEFIKEHYEVEHTLSLEEAMEDLEIICRNNGGMIA
jgi:hypothetical protein